MATTDKNTIYSYFQTDDFPTEEQFRATWDSFWHKSESIPMSSITGLNQLFQQTATVTQLNGKANVDGSNIDVSAYQEKLNITNLIATAKEEVKTELLNGAPEAFDTLKEISDWISDDETAEGAILQAIQTEAAARTNADNLKLDKPTTTSNTTSYPYVVGEDGNGNSARLPAGDLGKNFFNADLSNTTARNHTMNAGVTVNTLGNPHTLSGLPNKNADIANFRKVRVQNASGLDSVVDSKNLLTDGMTSMTDAEKDAWRLAQRKSNENYSTGQPRIDIINPPMIDKSLDNISYISLVGINLYIDNTSLIAKVIFTHSVTNEVVEITNYQVFGNSNIILLGENFSTWTLGEWNVKVQNQLGISSLNSIAKLNIVPNISSQSIAITTAYSEGNVEDAYFEITNNSIVFRSLTANAKNHYIQTDPIISQADMDAGVILDIDIVGVSSGYNWGNRDPSLACGFVDSNTNFPFFNNFIQGFILEPPYLDSTVLNEIRLGNLGTSSTRYSIFIYKGSINVIFNNKVYSSVINSSINNLSLKLWASGGNVNGGTLAINIVAKKIINS